MRGFGDRDGLPGLGRGIVQAVTVRDYPVIQTLAVLLVFGLLTPALLQNFRGDTNPVRIAIAVAILFPLGIFMGMMFPIGMKLAGSREGSLTPWLWAMNGATSVSGSVLVIGLSLAYGISFSFWVGTACYVAALAAAMWWGKRAINIDG